MTPHRRKNHRARTSIQAEFKTDAGSGVGKIRNVGEGGLFLGTSSLPSQGDPVLVRFKTPAGELVTLSGMVWWTTKRHHPSPGFGIRLLVANRRYDALVRTLLAL